MLTNIDECRFCSGGSAHLDENEIIKKSGGWVLLHDLDKNRQPLDNEWLIIPYSVHVESVEDILAFDGSAGKLSGLFVLLMHLGTTGRRIDNLTVNLTREGGQTFPTGHLHFRAIARKPGDPQLGMAGLIKLVLEQAAEIERLKCKLAASQAALHATEGAIRVQSERRR